MISNVKYLSFILLLVLTACKSGPAASQEQNGKQDTVKVFNLPDIPVVLNTVSQRADYMVKHYWDRFDFTDTTYVSQIDVAEQAWVDYCDLLEHVPLSLIYIYSMNHFLWSISHVMYKFCRVGRFCGFYRTLFYYT